MKAKLLLTISIILIVVSSFVAYKVQTDSGNASNARTCYSGHPLPLHCLMGQRPMKLSTSGIIKGLWTLWPSIFPFLKTANGYATINQTQDSDPLTDVLHTLTFKK